MQARYYDPVIGRFYSNDPVGALGHFSRGDGVHGFNRYAYVGNNPLTYTDPNGEKRYKFTLGVKLAAKFGLSGNIGFTVDTETYEASVFAGGTARAGAVAGFEVSIQAENSSKRGNSLSAKATADLSIGTGEESFKSELEVSTDKGFEGTPLKMEQALTFDDKGLSLKPNFGVSVGVGGQSEANISLPDTAKALENAIDNLSEKVNQFISNCQANPGTAC